ncbi:MAG: transcription antitermination protein NusB [Muribaculaceae bacterium]|nr:transcription antitermination protein NusB [Muribaculaceae bacterium]
MINRILIRIKVVQVLYSYVVSGEDQSIESSKKELLKSFEKSYELYHYLLKLMIDLTYMQERRLDDARHKYLPTHEDLNPNMKFVENELIAKLCDNQALNSYFEKHHISWQDDVIFMKMMLDKILNSDYYIHYMNSDSYGIDIDCELWRDLFKNVIFPDPDMAEMVESKSLFWSVEDFDIMGQFVLKTIRRIEEGESNPIMPMFKDEGDRIFGEQLFIDSILQMDKNNDLIDSLVSQRWDKDRIALMDRIIMCMALTELRGYQNIPTSVTLNEYIELAKNFSTSNSGQFVNGILNAAVVKLRASGEIIKP